ncbi:hypothetical protein SDC9_96001 [bioreactor metagenome]|uniref:Uncharacterized protein n=1 Tax=bioreactor metagenome TaxID=1076179 RepID=A0A645AEK2_9ZZZZ
MKPSGQIALVSHFTLLAVFFNHRRCDEKTGQDEKNVNSQVAARQNMRNQMIENDGNNRKRPHPIQWNGTFLYCHDNYPPFIDTDVTF